MCSRRKAEKLIEEGRVKVNGKAAVLGDRADPTRDRILVDETPVSLSRRKIYLAFYKPEGVETTLAERPPHSPNRRTLARYIKKMGFRERIYPVGRLDYDSEGLLILTNDGKFANIVMHPRYETEKTYEGLLDRPLREEDRQALEKGVILDGRKTWPARIEIKGPRQKGFRITIHEGRNRIVRRMFAAKGYRVIELKRTRIGPVSLGRLKPGQSRKLSMREVEILKGNAEREQS